MESVEEDYWWYRARREIICSTVSRFVATPGSMLDFGCGTGSIASRLRECGYRTVAADVCGSVLDVCRRRGLAVLDLTREWPARRTADGILACDVLEHVDDDAGLLNRLRESLRPGGCLIGTVPAYEFLWSGEDYVSDHRRRYTRPGFHDLLRRTGYRVVWSSYFNTLLFPLVLTAILGKRLLRPREMYRSNVRNLPSWQNSVLYRLFAVERSLLQRWLRFPFGASIIAVATPDHGLAA
jgi:SAM-dependent methyltransferase